MVQASELKVGLLVWWTAERSMKAWSCPCVVTYVDVEKNHYRVRSLDDFEETSNLLIDRGEGGDKSSLTEMRICTLDEVKIYFRERSAAMDISNAKRENAQREYLKKAEAFISARVV